jgi:hypothetical protein
MLLEPTDWIGGQMAAAGVTSMDEGYPPRGRLRERGIYGEFYGRARAYYRAIGKSTDTSAVSEDHFAVEPHVAQRILYEMIHDTRGTPLPGTRQAILDFLPYARVKSVLKQGQRVCGVNVEVGNDPSRVSQQDIASRVVIDATEYGDVIPLTGADYRVGIRLSSRDSMTQEPVPPVQPITWTASIKQYHDGMPAELKVTKPPAGYDEELISAFLSSAGNGSSARPWSFQRFLQYRGMPDSSSPLSAHNGAGLPLTRSHVNFYPNDQPLDVLGIEDLEAREKSEYQARLRTLSVLYYFQNVMGIDDWSVANDLGYDSPYNLRQIDLLIQKHPDMAPYRPVLRHFPVIAYVRESRRIVGVGTLRAIQIRRKRPFQPVRFHTAIAIGDYPVDVHGEQHHRGEQVELDLDEPADLPERWIQWGYGPFQIPLEALIPQTVDGFLPAEKNLSQSRIASGATRLQPITMLTGQAAGAIAALACRHDVQPRELPALAVQEALLDAGSTLSLAYYTDLPHGTELWKAVQLATLYEVLDYAEPFFHPDKRVNPTEIRQVCKRLNALQVMQATHAKDAITTHDIQAESRAEVAREIARVLLGTVKSVGVGHEVGAAAE